MLLSRGRSGHHTCVRYLVGRKAHWSRFSCRERIDLDTLPSFVRSFSSGLDITPVAMPSLSPTMTQGTIALWRAKPGDELKAGDVLCEIETDKASVGFEMQDDSVLAKILEEAQGKEILCGEPIALTVEDAAAYQEFLRVDPSAYAHLTASISASNSEAGESNNSGTTDGSSALAIGGAAEAVVQRLSPAARHMAESQALDTSKVVGTARGGLISKGDLILAVQQGIAVPDAGKLEKLKNMLNKGSGASSPSVLTSVGAATAGVAGSAASVASDHTASAAPSLSFPLPPMQPIQLEMSLDPVNSNFTDIPNNNMRKVIARRLTESKQTVPHFYTSIEVEIDSLMKLRKQLKQDFGVNVSVNDLIIKSAALALKDVPEANSKWNNNNSAVDAGGAKTVDISVAVATPNGLITPIVTGADGRGLADINATVRDLAGRAREGKLLPEEYQGGSFSISNLGMFGISSFSAVINPPQACILAVGAGIQKVLPPVASKRATATDAKEGGEGAGGEARKPQPRVTTTVTVQLSGDRRVVDEALAAQYLQVFKGYLGNPTAMLL